MTSTAKTAPSKPSRRMSPMACVIGVAWSEMDSNCTSVPDRRLRCRAAPPLTSLATVTVLAFGPLMICRPMLGLPLVRVIVSAGTETTCDRAELVDS